jgi:hypothetical protein
VGRVSIKPGSGLTRSISLSFSSRLPHFSISFSFFFFSLSLIAFSPGSDQGHHGQDPCSFIGTMHRRCRRRRHQPRRQLSLSLGFSPLSLPHGFSFLSYHRNSLRPPWPNRAPHRRRSSPPLMVEDFGSALPLSLAVVIGESVWVYGLGKTIYGSWVFFEPMWCLMLCEPVCV